MNLAGAYFMAYCSRDPSTQVGAVAMDAEGRTVGGGFNHIPVGTGIDIDTCTREQKHACVVHAEVHALLRASVQVHTLYVTWFACEGCASAMIAAGVQRAVAHAGCGKAFAKMTPSWDAPVARGHAMLRNAGVQMDFIEGPITEEPIRIGGRLWSPDTMQPC